MFPPPEVGEVKLDKTHLDTIALYSKPYGGALLRPVAEACRGTRRAGFAGLLGEHAEQGTFAVCLCHPDFLAMCRESRKICTKAAQADSKDGLGQRGRRLWCSFRSPSRAHCAPAQGRPVCALPHLWARVFLKLPDATPETRVHVMGRVLGLVQKSALTFIGVQATHPLGASVSLSMK